jgi:F0F1-type ATP synthase epsilon subunit
MLRHPINYRVLYDVMLMTPARQRLDKHVPEVTLPTTEGRLKAGIVESE